MEELKIWLLGFIKYTEKKVKFMKRDFPDHRNIRRFEGEILMAKNTLRKIGELSGTNTKNRKQEP